MSKYDNLRLTLEETRNHEIKLRDEMFTFISEFTGGLRHYLECPEGTLKIYSLEHEEKPGNWKMAVDYEDRSAKFGIKLIYPDTNSEIKFALNIKRDKEDFIIEHAGASLRIETPKNMDLVYDFTYSELIKFLKNCA